MPLARHHNPAQEGLSRVMNTSEHAGNVNGNESGCDLLWGYDEIGRAIGRSGRQVEHLRRSGALKSVKKALSGSPLAPPS
jgi:hypothetical protein